MKRSIVSSSRVAIVLLMGLLASGCVSQSVKCDRHLVPINVPHGKPMKESSR